MKMVQLKCKFDTHDFDRQSSELDVKLKDVLVRLENLKLAFDKKNDIFSGWVGEETDDK
jgi:hypothetical protein